MKPLLVFGGLIYQGGMSNRKHLYGMGIAVLAFFVTSRIWTNVLKKYLEKWTFIINVIISFLGLSKYKRTYFIFQRILHELLFDTPMPDLN